MKNRLLCLPVSTCLAAITLSSCLLPMSASAAVFRWDPGLTPLTPSGGNGDWDTTTASWSNGTSDVVWPVGTNDYAIFGGTAGTANVATGVNANRLIFSTTGYTVSGASAITLSGNTPQLNANSGINATVGTTLTFAGTDSVTKSGAGKISLTSAATAYTGATVLNGGILALETTGALPSGNALSISNGELTLTGTAAGARAQTVGALTPNAGRDVVTLTADAAQPITLTAASLATRAVGSSILVRGTGLGTTAPGTAGAANVLFTTAPTLTTSVITVANNPFTSTGTGTLGTTQAAVLRGFTVNTDPTGAGISFATYDTNGVRALNASEKLTVADGAAYTAASAGDNVVIDLTGAFAITGKQTNTLQVNNTSGSLQTLTNSGTALLPTNGLLFTGNSATTLTGGTLTFNNGSGANSDIVVHSSNSALVTISNAFAVSGASLRSFTFGGTGNFLITSANIPSSSNGGNYFNGPGNVELRCTAYGASSAGTVINNGTVTLGTGFALSGTVARAVFVANGATFDINNIQLGSTATSGLDSIQNVNAYGGTVTNSGGTVTNLTLTQLNNSGDFAGTVTGNINLIENRQGNTTTNGRTQKFTGPLTYVGSTSITSASTTSTADAAVAANPTAFMIIGGGGSLPSGTDLTLGGQIIVNGTTYGVATNGANANGVLTLGDTVANTGGPVNQTVASLATGLSPGPVTAILGGATTNSTLTVNGSSSTTFAGKIGGTGTNNNRLALVRGGTGSLTLAGANTYVGDTTISNPAASLALSSTGSLSFIIGANGVNNKITGVAQTTGTLTLAGTFNFDLTGANKTVGNSWQIIDAALLPTTTSTALTVAGFTGSSGTWKKPDVVGFQWVFKTSTGALTYEAAPGYATWAAANGIPGEPATGDFEFDGITNLIEYGLGTNPTVSTTPAGVFSGTTVTFTKGSDAITNGDVSWTIQESDDLGISDPWANVVTQPAGDTSLTITHTLPPGQPKVFMRLVVIQN